MLERWVNVQPNGGFEAGDTLAGYTGVLAILDWQTPCDAALVEIERQCPVRLWRWVENPLTWVDWPDKYIVRCPVAVFANEPDLEGYPSWYRDAILRWAAAGGEVVCPAWHNEAMRAPDAFTYDYFSWHAYAGNFGNRDLLLAKNLGKPIIGTEYGRANDQGRAPDDISNIPEPVAIFAWRWANNAASGYDVWNKELRFMNSRVVPMPPMLDVPSPNYWAGRRGNKVTAIVPHGTAGPGAVSWFQNPQSQVSAHFVIDVDGTITKCVSTDDSAWHAGVVTPNSKYANLPNPNYWTIGIEHVRNTSNTSLITPQQVEASASLVAYLRDQYPTIVSYILHDAIDVGRICPGPDFPAQEIWDRSSQLMDSGSLTTGTNSGTTVVTATTVDTTEQEAQGYYFQHGIRVDVSHAIWHSCLLPLYREWQAVVNSNSSLADAVCPGPLVAPESGTTWGLNTPAAMVKTENAAYGVRQMTDGTWAAYRVRVF